VGALVLVLLGCAAIVAFHVRSERLLQDSDTRVMLARLAARNNPWSWFKTDWPLLNHFYRPITALSFELDRRLFTTAAGFGLSASIYCALCVLGVFWLARELTDKPAVSAGAALLFALWHCPYFIAWDQVMLVVAAAVALAGIVRHRLKVAYYLPALLAVTFLATELSGVHLREAPEGFYRGILAWLPSRTATLATLFALISMAAYVRFERLGSSRAPSEPSPTDPPTTRTSSQAEGVSSTSWIWLPVSVVAAGLSLGAYEQAAMLPFLLLLAAGLMRARGYAVRWASHIWFWVLLLAVVAVRSRVLPHEPSAYQQQQIRGGLNAFLSANLYFFPTAGSIPSWWSILSLGPAVLATAFVYLFWWNLAGNGVAYWKAFLKNRLAPFAWICSALAFLPMAFLKPFPHYHYWPMALRSIFVVMLVGAVWDTIVSAASPPSRRAPERLVPAPGSLPHP
jgi:hypothetical protein